MQLKGQGMVAMTGGKQVTYKAFFGVFENFSLWPFNSLLPIYIYSPFINFDKPVIPLLKNHTSLYTIGRTNQEENCSDLIKSIKTRVFTCYDKKKNPVF